MKKIISLLFVFFSLLLACKKQTNEIEKFDNLFEPLTADTLKISYVEEKGLQDSLVSGKKIPATFYHLFEFPGEFVQDTVGYSSRVFVNAYKKIDFGDRVGYLVTFYNEDIHVDNFICLYMYNKSTGKMSPPEIIQNAYGFEGSEGFTQSWMYDLNKDGKKDLIKWVYECNVLSIDSVTDVKISHFVDTLTAEIWADTVFKATFPDNYKQLKKRLTGNYSGLCGTKE